MQRLAISQSPEVQGEKPVKKKFKACPLGYFLVDIAKVQTAEGKLFLFVAFDRTSKLQAVLDKLLRATFCAGRDCFHGTSKAVDRSSIDQAHTPCRQYWERHFENPRKSGRCAKTS